MEHLFVADTNIFFECKNLEDLPWAELGPGPLVIALTKPVMGEIDKHKKGTARTRRRAIDISGRIRAILDTNADDEIIRAQDPRVALRLMPLVKPEPSLADDLDYTVNDDRIVGIGVALKQQGAFATVTLLTDDSVAASTAKSVGLPFQMIPASWRRPAEETPEAKQIKELEKALTIYKSQEPEIKIRTDDDATAYAVEQVDALPIEAPELDRLIEALRAKHPIRADFTPPPAETAIDGTITSYDAPRAEDIEKYTQETYPNWLRNCRVVLEKLHEGRGTAQPAISVVFAIRNDGTRPASKVRVDFEALGSLRLQRPPRAVDGADEDGQDDKSETASPPLPRLPIAPKAPDFKRIVRRPAPVKTEAPPVGIRLNEIAAASRNSALFPSPAMLDHLQRQTRLFSELANPHLSVTASLRAAMDQNDVFRSLMQPPETYAFARPLTHYLPSINLPEPPDPERFYYDEWPRSEPVQHGSLTCDLFRHQNEEELLEVKVLFVGDGDRRILYTGDRYEL